MREGLLIIFALLFVEASIQAQSISQREKKRLRLELKGYLNNIESYHARMADLHSTIVSNEKEIKLLKDELLFSTSKQSELERKAAVSDSIAMSLQQEIAVLRGDPLTGTVKRTKGLTPNNPISTPQSGVVYKVQIGVYRKFNINNYFEEPRCIGYEDIKGMNKYSIGYFTDEEIAREFMRDIRKMGIKDAFVTKYVNGKRDYRWSSRPR